jgi:membrane-associated protein
MDALKKFLDVLLHLQDHLNALAAEYGVWIYAILFLIIFAETGLVVTPILPGDSLLFAVGALAAGGTLNFWLACAVMLVAAILGDTANYWVGKLAGVQLQRRFPRLIRRGHIDKTHAFFEKFGGKTIILARFVPIIRTFAPFVAGMGAMNYGRFMLFNVTGALLWIGLVTPCGWFFGSQPVVKKNFELVVLGIIFVSVLPMAYEFWKARRAAGRTAPPA